MLPSTTKRQTNKKDQFFINEIQNQIQSLPEEWTVVQINKRYNALNIAWRSKDIITHDCGLWITLIRYSRSELNNHQPILLEVPPKDGNTVYETIYNLISDFKNIINYNQADDSKESRALYWKKVENYNQQIEASLKDQKRMVASWIFLLLGKYQTSDKESRKHEAKIYEKVDELCTAEKLSSEQQILLSLIGRSIHLIEPEDAFEFCTYFESDIQKLTKIMKLLLTLKLNTPTLNKPKYPQPCLLIVDEHLDFLFWEAYVVEQPITRLSSFNILMSLYKKYANDIKNGYLQVDVSNGFAIINPENNLPLMEARVTELFDHCLPHWKKKIQSKPTTEELLKELHESSIFMYFGHGSGLQFLQANSITFASVSSITFLFGCGSVQLNSTGGWYQMLGPHIYYHIAQCPAVFGFLVSVTDYPTDCLASIICERWLKVKNKWKDAERKKWKTKERYDKLLNEKTSREPNLLKVLTDLRQDNCKLIPIMQKLAMCLRGLPIKAKE